MLNSEHKPNYSTSAGILPMPCCVQPGIEIYYADNAVVMPLLADESIDIICIDPPYLYLKGQKLERPFDEQKFFTECKRVLTEKGFIILFGRGTSFYRWNTILNDLGFVFKEEVIWDKSYTSSPHNSINRVHETIVIYTAKCGILNKVLIPYEEAKEGIDDIIMDLKRIKSALKSQKEIKDIECYVKEGITIFQNLLKPMGYGATNQTNLKQRSRGLATIKSINEGMRIKSIIKEVRDHYTSIHPTQKPVKLLERLLALVIPQDKENIVVADFFAGSMSCMEAVYNVGLKGIAVEIDEEYFEAGKKRLLSLPPRQCSLFD